MNKITMGLVVGLAFCAAHASAEDAVKDQPQTEQKAPGERLKAEYKVDDARINALRDKKYGYGEIKKVLSLASKMEGGITDENVAKITAMRDAKMGWGQIAKKQGVHPGSINGKGPEKWTEKGEKPEKAGKPEKAERPEKAEKPEKPARPEKSHGKH